ncbi:hypothetical protein JXB27_02495 [Candidatus Woesearchaeota archaeon]|nr:hypothetical protein [Candidatus Woesearchaeota archaeon]
MKSRLVIPLTAMLTFMSVHGCANNPARDYQTAQTAMKTGDYASARKHFAKIIQAGQNPYFNLAADYINIGGKDLLFKQMVQHYEKLISAEYSAADALVEQAKKTDNKEEKAKLERQARGLLEDIIAKKKELCNELAKRNIECK